jgi:hypothetical protein
MRTLKGNAAPVRSSHAIKAYKGRVGKVTSILDLGNRRWSVNIGRFTSVTHRMRCILRWSWCGVSLELHPGRVVVSLLTELSIIRAMNDGCSKNLWNVGQFLPDYTAQRPRRQSSSDWFYFVCSQRSVLFDDPFREFRQVWTFRFVWLIA